MPLDFRALVTATADPRPVALARIGVGAAVLLKALIVAPVLLRIGDPTRLRLPFAEWLPVLPGSAVLPLLGAWAAAGAAFLVGWHTRLAGSALSVILLVTLLGDQQLYSNHLYLLFTLVLLLTIARSGAACSLDAGRSAVPAAIPRWPVTLLKVQLTLVYGFAALAKLDLPYLSGAVLNAHMGRGALLPIPEALRIVEVMAPLAWLSILVEGFLALAFWSPRWRKAACVAGVLFHLSVILLIAPASELIVFAVVMFSLYLLHFEDGWGPRNLTEERVL